LISKANFSLTQLEYILAVAKHGHFAKAAAACHVTQPTLSMQLQKLEEELGVVIFDRSKKPILLTDVGRKLVEQAQAVLFEARKMEGIAHSSKAAGVRGELTLGVIPTIAPYLLPMLLPVIERKFPELKLNILELQTKRIVEDLQEDEIDVGLLATPLKVANIHETALFYEPFSVLCRGSHPLARQKKISYASLKHEDIWLLEEGHCLRHQVLDVCSLKRDKGKTRQFRFESGNLETLKNLVDSFGGYTLLPKLASERLGANSVTVEFERPVPAREIGLVVRREHYKGELIEALAKAILECIPEEVRRIRQKDLDVLPVQ